MMTTRKHAAAVGLRVTAMAGALACVVFGGAGCATPGPLHVYAIGGADNRNVRDTGDARTAEVPSFLETDERLIGFAYDPFTDHFFLRLNSGEQVRVVDRPAKAIKRDFDIAAPALGNSGDLTVRPRDGHLFFLQADSTALLETSRLGKTIRTVPLAGITAPPIGVAHDATNDRLLILAADGRRVTTHDPSGASIGALTLAQPAGACLAFDPEKREIYAPLRDRPGEIGIFDETGKFLRLSAARGAFVDLGVRSFVRVF